MLNTRTTFSSIPAILTFRDCCNILSISKNTLLGLIQRKEITAFRVGKQYRFRREDYQYIIRNLIKDGIETFTGWFITFSKKLSLYDFPQ